MDLAYNLDLLLQNAERIRCLVEGMSDQDARWKPDADSWSIMEVINHLADEEEADFIVRLDYTLNRNIEPWPPIDPEGWVSERRYNERSLGESLRRFLSLRQHSWRWLKGLADPNWETVYNAPFGPIRAGDIFAAWVAHDLLHMRQIIEVHWAFLNRKVTPYSVRYAGDW